MRGWNLTEQDVPQEASALTQNALEGHEVTPPHHKEIGEPAHAE
jgi:hypothetical protein